MSKLSVVIVILSVVLFNTFYCSDNSNLLSVIVIYRHGARAPKATYKNDPYKDMDWGAEHGHLTNTGIRQLYDLGKWFRQRYDGFLSRKYLSSEFQVVSSDKDRCLMSAAACLAGLYPPEGDQIWNKDLLWQPIPIRMIPDNDDAILKQWKRCAKHDRLHGEEMKKEYMRDLFRENQELFKFVSEKSGENIQTLRQMKYLFHIFKSQTQYNISLPEWTKDIFEKMKCLAIIEITSYTHTTELARLKCGPLIDIIIRHFDGIVKKKDVPKFQMYSAHYTTLQNILNTMQLRAAHLFPDFASVVIFELRKDEDEKHFVNMLYKNFTHLQKLTLNGCRYDCDFDKYQQLLAPVRISLRDWVRECFE